MSQRRKVTVVGAGNVGATCAQVLATRDYADVVLVDIKEGLPQGKALDINQMGAVLGYEPNVTGANEYGPSAGSDVIVITAGLPRSPGMSRDDLVTTNEKIVKDVTEKVIAEFAEALDKTAPDVVPLPDVDPEIQAKASRLARRRAAALLENLGSLVAPARATRNVAA